MKHIIIALGMLAFMYTSAEAQTCCICKKKSALKHKTTTIRVNNNLGLQQQQTTEQSCRVVPYQVCTINPDRRSVSCYKTVDPDHEQAWDDETITYGPTGSIPGQAEKQNVETIVIPGSAKADYCKRNDADNATVCYRHDVRLERNEQGFYYYK